MFRKIKESRLDELTSEIVVICSTPWVITDQPRFYQGTKDKGHRTKIRDQIEISHTEERIKLNWTFSQKPRDH